MTKFSLSVFTVVCVSSGIGCTVESADSVPSPTDCSVQIANTQLYSIHDHLRLQELLRNQQVRNESVDNQLAGSILGRIIVLRATSVDVTALKGVPLETLCLLTTDDVRAELAIADDEVMVKAAFEYLDSMEAGVRQEVSRIQKNMLGTGCSLSP